MVGTLFKNIKIVWKHIGGRRRLQVKLLCVLVILVSFAEVLSIGAVFPFFGALMQPQKVYENATLHPLIKFLNIGSPSEVILPVTILFCIAVLIAGAMRIISTWLSVRLSFSLGSYLSNDIYSRTLHQPYVVHVARNSSEIVNGIWVKVSEVIFYILMPMLILISNTILVITLVIALWIVTPNIALEAIGGLVVVYAVIMKLSRKKLKSNSIHIARESNNLIKNLQEGLSGIRDVLLDGSQDSFSDSYNKINQTLRRAQGSNQIINQVPNFILMAFGMILIAVLAYTLTLTGGFAKAMPSLVALTLGLQKILPCTQQLFSSWSTIIGAQASLDDVITLLQQPYPDDMDAPSPIVPFNEEITLDHISFKYNQGSPIVLNDISLKIPKGTRIGFIGTTGCGKSTLLDIVMGLLTPTEGSLKVDGQVITQANCRSWQKHIAHVPQSVFLADTTIERNIAFGIPQELIDFERVKLAAQQAQIASVIDTWPEKYQTSVGERGVQLSGGQCQRIGIARALYKQADLIILDEATSALDNETEREILASIELLSKDITIVMIAHRLNTLDFCNEIIELGKGGIIGRKIIQ